MPQAREQLVHAEWLGDIVVGAQVQRLSLARSRGLKLDIMRTSFFLSRRTLLVRRGHGLDRLQDLVFVFLARNAVRAADYFQIPPSRVVELGAQVTL